MMRARAVRSSASSCFLAAFETSIVQAIKLLRFGERDVFGRVVGLHHFLGEEMILQTQGVSTLLDTNGSI